MQSTHPSGPGYFERSLARNNLSPAPSFQLTHNKCPAWNDKLLPTDLAKEDAHKHRQLWLYLYIFHITFPVYKKIPLSSPFDKQRLINHIVEIFHERRRFLRDDHFVFRPFPALGDRTAFFPKCFLLVPMPHLLNNKDLLFRAGIKHSLPSPSQPFQNMPQLP